MQTQKFMGVGGGSGSAGRSRQRSGAAGEEAEKGTAGAGTDDARRTFAGPPPSRPAMSPLVCARLLCVLLLAVGLPVAGGCTDPATGDAVPDHAGDHASMDHSAMDPGVSSYSDLAFLDHMTAHHRMAVGMAEMAARADAGADVRRLAGEITASQQAEIDSMTAWRARWFADAPAATPPSADEMAAMGMADMDMDALGAARGADFDRLFLAQMIPHHAGAVTMAADARAHSERPEVRRLADAIIAAQAREIGQMQTWVDAAPSDAAPSAE